MIRPYRDDDLDDVLDVWYAASRVAHAFLGETFLMSERREIAEHWLPIAETFVDETDGQVCGFLSLIGNEVGGVFVHPARQQQGIGRALIDRARAARSFLELDVFEENAGARRFYETYGFVEAGSHVHEPTGHVELHLRLD